jgi:hypothetical protein
MPQRPVASGPTPLRGVDRVLASRWLGGPAFLLVMWGLFVAAARLAGPLQAGLAALIDGPVKPGPAAETLAQQRIDAFAATYAKAYPAAIRCLLDDRHALTAYLRFPAEHWHRIRHSNFIERTFGETRRRTKVIGRLPGETSCVSLVWALLDRASRGWRGFTVTAAGTRLLQELRLQILHPPTPIRRHARNVRRPAAKAA